MRVSDILRSKNRIPLTVRPDTLLSQCVINHHQRYIPVLDKGALVGVLSFHDVARTVFAEQEEENKMLKHYIGDMPLCGATV